ncbi:hypothetical protein GE09DRAFT_1100998, partial [Coniochaeta sp. 2T2.1]
MVRSFRPLLTLWMICLFLWDAMDFDMLLVWSEGLLSMLPKSSFLRSLGSPSWESLTLAKMRPSATATIGHLTVRQKCSAARLPPQNGD